MSEHEFKIVFTGPMGAGKTTAIAAISDEPPVSTDVVNTDRAAFDKPETTAGLDYGRIALDGGASVRLYGTPGQLRYRFLWDILGSNAAGVIVLIDAAQADALVQLDAFVDAFGGGRRAPIVVGIGRSGQSGALPLDAFAQRLESHGLTLPVFGVDVRRRDDVLLLVDTLLCLLELDDASRRTA
ncbi:MAG TPA: GTP-binding protein [Tahibacter sp.]|uniref:GTP-binding protein n=1 Tax=Tahibacter sp. TaxID=2056211 RepID=UPI002D13D652|nr:GTP-binding protein [Tahibacter sp.]HSX62429.1 GTP-binding protein [Tahibacter sp.]